MFSFIFVWINSWVNNREVGDLRCYHSHYDVIVMFIRNAQDINHSANHIFKITTTSHRGKLVGWPIWFLWVFNPPIHGVIGCHQCICTTVVHALVYGPPELSVPITLRFYGRPLCRWPIPGRIHYLYGSLARHTGIRQGECLTHIPDTDMSLGSHRLSWHGPDGCLMA